jgi:hypothetical protein
MVLRQTLPETENKARVWMVLSLLSAAPFEYWNSCAAVDRKYKGLISFPITIKNIYFQYRLLH